MKAYGGWAIALIVTVTLIIILASGVTGPYDGVDIALFAFNDVYELKPIGHYGGLARVKTYKNVVEDEFPNAVISILPGDFYSPSALGTATWADPSSGEKRALRGRQMVDVLNHVGIDVATFGNHEFDIPADDFLARVKESQFPYVATNVLSNREGSKGEMFDNTVSSMFIERKGVTFAFLGVVIDANKGLATGEEYADIKSFADSVPLVQQEIASWRARGQAWDVLVAVTHLNLEDDMKLVEAVPEIDISLGGHEHQNWYINRGEGRPVFIAKADCNVRTVFTHRLHFARSKAVAGDRFGTAAQNPGALTLKSELYTIDDFLVGDSAVAAVVDKWWNIAKEAFAASGLDIDKPMAKATEDLDARDVVTRYQSPSPFTAFLAEAYYAATVDEAPAGATPLFAIYPAGSIRIDDYLRTGVLTEYDVLRVVPFGGKLNLLKTSGARIKAALAHALSMPGNGSWLAYSTARLQCDLKTRACLYLDPASGQFVAFEDETEYAFTTIDYVTTGGDDYFPGDRAYLTVVKDDFTLSVQEALRKAFTDKYPLQGPMTRLSAKTPSVFY